MGEGQRSSYYLSRCLSLHWYSGNKSQKCHSSCCEEKGFSTSLIRIWNCFWINVTPSVYLQSSRALMWGWIRLSSLMSSLLECGNVWCTRLNGCGGHLLGVQHPVCTCWGILCAWGRLSCVSVHAIIIRIIWYLHNVVIAMLIYDLGCSTYWILWPHVPSY